MRDKRDTKKKRFIETLAAQGTVSHAAQAAGVSRNTAYRWREDDLQFASLWHEAHEKAVDAVESSLHQKAVSDAICMIFYLKAHRPIYRDRLNIDIKQVQSEIEERMAQIGVTSHLLARAMPMLTE
jgi:phage terminase small subunit